MHTRTKRSDKFDAAAGKYETCRLTIRNFLLAKVEAVSCAAAAVILRRYNEYDKHSKHEHLKVAS